MSWQGIEGHDAIVERFRSALGRGRLAHTFLFVGPEGIGKRTFAVKLAQALLCQNQPAPALDPCGQCPACRQVLAGTHPDLLVVAKPADKSAIPIELLIGPPEKRMQEGLCHEISLRSFAGGRKVAIIDDADDLSVEGANALLKTLEEPPLDAVIILIGTSAEKQLPTIRSRSQIVSFRPLAAATIARLLIEQGSADAEMADRLAQFSEGSLGRARNLADPELWQFRAELLKRLSSLGFDSVALARQSAEFIDAAGKEASARRHRARQLITFAVDLFRQLVRALAGYAPPIDEAIESSVDRLQQAGWEAEQAAQAVDRSLEALRHVDRNVHLATVVESWLDDLARLAEQSARISR